MSLMIPAPQHEVRMLYSPPSRAQAASGEPERKLMSRTAIQIGPADNGRRMSLSEFEHAEAREGFRYELGRGVVIVVDVPNFSHAAQLDAISQRRPHRVTSPQGPPPRARAAARAGAPAG